MACFRIEFEAAIQSRAEHAVMKVRQPQNMPSPVLPKPSPKLFREAWSVGIYHGAACKLRFEVIVPSLDRWEHRQLTCDLGFEHDQRDAGAPTLSRYHHGASPSFYDRSKRYFGSLGGQLVDCGEIGDRPSVQQFLLRPDRLRNKLCDRRSSGVVMKNQRRKQPASKPLSLKLKEVTSSRTKPRVAQPGFVQRVVVRGMSISLPGLRFTEGG
jgi:hypothetical protein